MHPINMRCYLRTYMHINHTYFRTGRSCTSSSPFSTLDALLRPNNP
jgi:hypothetical protein